MIIIEIKANFFIQQILLQKFYQNLQRKVKIEVIYQKKRVQQLNNCSISTLAIIIFDKNSYQVLYLKSLPNYILSPFYNQSLTFKMKKLYNHIILMLMLSFLSWIAQTTLPIVATLPTKNIQVEFGQHYSYEIPQYFQTYQHARIVNFTHQKKKFNGKVCSISILNESFYESKDVIFHFQLTQPSPQYFGDKLIYKFEDLIKINQVMDAAVFNGKIIVLFQTKHYVVYSVSEKGSITVLKSNQSILSQFAGLSYGNFIQNSQSLLFFSETQIFYFNQKSNLFQPVTGYDPIGVQFEYATIYNNTIYVAAAQIGIIIYEFKTQTKTIYKKLHFNITEGQQAISYKLTPIDIQYDHTNNFVYVIDSQEGIRWFKTPTEDTITQVSVQKSTIFVQNCQNLHLTNQFLYATCPNVLKVSLTNKSDIQIGPTVGFYPAQMIVNNSRVILLGDNMYAIWDTEGGSIQAGHDVHLISMGFVQNDWIIIVNQFDISVGSITPSMQEMYCQLDKTDQIVGKNQFKIALQGICSQILIQKTSNLLNQVQSGNCIIQQPITLIVTDSSIIDYLIYFVLIGVLVWSGCVGAMYLCVKHIKIRKGYQDLPQQNTGVQQGKSQEVMSSKSQQIQTNKSQ